VTLTFGRDTNATTTLVDDTLTDGKAEARTLYKVVELDEALED
jgi:hypothetical protein